MVFWLVVCFGFCCDFCGCCVCQNSSTHTFISLIKIKFWVADITAWEHYLLPLGPCKGKGILVLIQRVPALGIWNCATKAVSTRETARSSSWPHLKPPPFGEGGVGSEGEGGLSCTTARVLGKLAWCISRVPASTFLTQAKPYINIRLIYIVST